MIDQLNKKEYDGVLSLGCWCQVGAVMWAYKLKEINSPLDNYGIKEWRNLIHILENRFSDYWELENISRGREIEHYSLRYAAICPMYKVYDNKYNLVSRHFFHAIDNTPDELLTYPDFKEKMDVLAQVFLAQCESYERVLFVCKLMSKPQDPTIVERNDIKRLSDVLFNLRKGKPYDLRIAVLKDQYPQIKQWVEEDQLHHIQLFPSEIIWNGDMNHEEWIWMYRDVKLADNYLTRLNDEIIGITDPESTHLNYLNS